MDIPTAQLLLQVLHIIPNIVGAIDTTEKDDNIILGDKNMKETVSWLVDEVPSFLKPVRDWVYLIREPVISFKNIKIGI